MTRKLVSYDDLLGVKPQLSLERLINYTRIPPLGASGILVQGVEQPSKEFDRVSLLGYFKLARRSATDLLKKIVWGDLGFEQAGVPDFFGEDRKPFEKLWLLTLVIRQ